MTICCAKRHGTGWDVATDSACQYRNGTRALPTGPKWVDMPGCIILYAGAYYHAKLLAPRIAEAARSFKGGADPFEFAARVRKDALAGFREATGVDDPPDCTLLVLFPHGWAIRYDGNAADPQPGPSRTMLAIGTGEDFALGAMMAGASPTEAVRIACRAQIDCGPPVYSLAWRPHG